MAFLRYFYFLKDIFQIHLIYIVEIFIKNFYIDYAL